MRPIRAPNQPIRSTCIEELVEELFELSVWLSKAGGEEPVLAGDLDVDVARKGRLRG